MFDKDLARIAKGIKELRGEAEGSPQQVAAIDAAARKLAEVFMLTADKSARFLTACGADEE